MSNFGLQMQLNHQNIDLSKIKHLLTDSRNLTDPTTTLFFCLEGKGRAGVDYIAELYDKGVRHFVVPIGHIAQFDANYIYCKSPLDFLQELAKNHRLSYDGTVVAITGSNGKTVVKEWLFQILNKHQYTYRSPKSYNSQVGVPFSLWGIPNSSQLSIIEAGISQVDEMQKLASIIKPQIGIFTMLGNAHQENFQSQEEKISEKLKLFAECESIIYRKDNPLVQKAMQASFSETNLLAWSLGDREASLCVDYDKTTKQISLYGNKQCLFASYFPYSDEASIENIGHCLVCAWHLGIDMQLIDLTKIEAVAMRLEHKKGNNGCSLISDAYNNDILSLGIALDALNKLAESKNNSRTVILSDIDQSGLSDAELYKKIAFLLKKKGVNRLIGIGEKLSKNQSLFNIKSQEFHPSTEHFTLQIQSGSFENESILFKGGRRFEFEKIIRFLEERRHQTTLEIDINTLRDNFNYFKSILRPTTKIMGMVKAFAYGSGATETARVLQQQGCDYLAVAVADEGVELRQNGISLPIAVMTPERNSFEAMLKYALEPAIYSFSELQSFYAVAKKASLKDYPVHLKFDTGMHRLGFSAGDLSELLAFFKTQKTLKITSIFSHLAAADESQWDDFTLGQIERFEDISKEVNASLDHNVLSHILNSAGTERFTQYQHDMVRLGIGMYGISAVGENMQQIATLKTAITQVRQLSKEETVGYGRKGKLNRQSLIATLPIGYADGLNRLLGNGNGYALVNGQKAPYIGNICMDLSMIDITGIDACEGDEVILMGKDLKASEIATQINTIPYEILTSISQRVKRVYVE